jgi:acetolactate synthase-1/3 small subunit
MNLTSTVIENSTDRQAEVTVFAPASMGNVAVGYDVLGSALNCIGDRVTVRRIEEPVVRIGEITGRVTDLPTAPDENTATVALLDLRDAYDLNFGFEVSLEKGIPLGSGLGGSAASAVGAVVAGVFAPLTVGATTDEDRARMTIVIDEPEPGIDQAKKQLQKLIPVIDVRELDPTAVRRELVILKVNGDEPDKVQAITEMYDGDTLDAGPRTITVEITGDQQKISDAIDAFRQFGIREIARTGDAAVARGEEPTAKVEADGTPTQVTADDD